MRVAKAYVVAYCHAWGPFILSLVHSMASSVRTNGISYCGSHLITIPPTLVLQVKNIVPAPPHRILDALGMDPLMALKCILEGKEASQYLSTLTLVG